MNKSLLSLRTTLLNIAHVQLDHRWDYDNVISPFSRLYHIKSGMARVYHHDQVFELRPGYLYLIPSFTYSRYKCDDRMEQVYAHFLEEVGAGLSIYNLHSFKYQVKASSMAVLLFERLLELNPNRSLSKLDPKVYDNRPAVSNFEAMNNSLPAAHFMETNGILQVLLSLFMEEGNTLVNPPQQRTSKITDSIFYIGEHLHQELTVAHLASRCHVDPDYFSRLFKEQTGVRPLKYLQNKRIERAQVLLTTTNHTLQEIADMVGLSNISYFNRLFVKLTGKPPGSFRKEHWNI